MQEDNGIRSESVRNKRNAIRIMIKNGFLWFGYIWIYRIVTLILYTIFFGSTVEAAVYEKNFAEARDVTVLASLVSVLLFGVFYTVIYSRSNGKERRELFTASREEGFGYLGYFKKYIPEMALYTAVHFMTQLIFCGFYTAFGFRFDETQTLIERLHVADSGFYLMTGILGLLLNTLYMALTVCLMRLAVLVIWKNDKNYKIK